MKYKFKIGDRIEVIYINPHSYIKIGMKGTILENDSKYPYIKMDEFIGGGNCGGLCEVGYGTAINQDNLKLIDSDLKFENEALKSKIEELTKELDKLKPKPESITIDLYLHRDVNNKLVWSYMMNKRPNWKPVAIKTVTITEGEGL